MQHVLITGGSDGLGKTTAHKLIAAGFKVTILSRDESKTKATAEELGCKYVVADVSDASQVEIAFLRAIEQSGEIDILINNAGIWILGTLESNNPADIKHALDVNALGTIYCTRAVVTAMKARKSGRIINVISQAGLNAKAAERSVYNAGKWAITGFTKSMQVELRPYKVSVYGFYPGAMDTKLFAKIGDTKVRNGALDTSVVAEMLVYLSKLPANVEIPEMGVQSMDYGS